jgi:hypothetical protein
MRRVKGDRLAEALDGFARPLLGVQQVAQVVVGVEMLRIERDGHAVRRFGVGVLPLRTQQPAEVVVCVGMAGIDGQRVAARVDG